MKHTWNTSRWHITKPIFRASCMQWHVVICSLLSILNNLPFPILNLTRPVGHALDNFLAVHFETFQVKRKLIHHKFQVGLVNLFLFLIHEINHCWHRLSWLSLVTDLAMVVQDRFQTSASLFLYFSANQCHQTNFKLFSLETWIVPDGVLLILHWHCIGKLSQGSRICLPDSSHPP